MDTFQFIVGELCIVVLVFAWSELRWLRKRVTWDKRLAWNEGWNEGWSDRDHIGKPLSENPYAPKNGGE